MELNDLINKIEGQNSLNYECFKELEKMKEEVKSYYSINTIIVVAEITSYMTVIYHVAVNFYDIVNSDDIIEEKELEEKAASGYLTIIEL